MAITTILHNHFQKDNVKQIISRTGPYVKSLLKYSLKEIQPNYLKEKKKRLLCTWCSRERHRTSSPEEAQLLTRNEKSKTMPESNLGCSGPLHPIQETECGRPPPHLARCQLGNGGFSFHTNVTNHWVVYLKKHFLKENSLLVVRTRKTIIPYCVLKWKKIYLCKLINCNP